MYKYTIIKSFFNKEKKWCIANSHKDMDIIGYYKTIKEAYKAREELWKKEPKGVK